MKKPEISNYYDYRKFLSDFFIYKKTENSNYSYRVFTSKAGLKSSGHLKMIVSRERNLGAKTLPLYLKAIGFKRKSEKSLFETLVKYDQSTNNEEKADLLEIILKEKKKNNASLLDSSQYLLLSQWYIVTIYVMLGLSNPPQSLEQIHSLLLSKIPLLKVQRAMEILQEVGLIKNQNGVFKQVSGALSTPDEIKSIAVGKYHEAMITLSQASLKRDNVDERNFNGVTIAVSKKNYRKVTKRLNQFRKELNELIGDDKEATQVYQISLNMFPLTKEYK